VRSKAASKRVGNSIYKFLRDCLRLPINREKSGLRRPSTFHALGYGLVPTYKKGEKGRYQLVVESSKWKGLQQKLKAITRKTTPMTIDERMERIGQTMRGWINYFRLASIQGKLKKLEGWLRNRLRYCIWHHWKKPEKKRRSLIRLGVAKGMAYAWSRTRMGGWRVAQSSILGTTITLERLEQRGYTNWVNYYEQLKVH